MKGIIYIDMCGYRGYGFGLIEYLKTKGNFLGGEGNVNLFEIKDNKLYYNNKNINTQLYSHLFFIYKCDELDIKSARDKKLIKKFNKMKRIESWFIKNTDIIIINKISNSKYDTYRNDFFDKLKEIVNVPEYKLIKNEKDMNTFFAMMGKSNWEKANYDEIENQLGDVPHTFADISKAKRDLDYDPKIKLEEGLRLMYNNI